jgi:hypothetical protein
MAAVILLPLQEQIPTVGGFSIMWIFFAVMSTHILLHNSGALAKTWTQPVFLAAYTFFLIAVLTESLHSNADYIELFSIAQMIGGAVIVASLCRDREALRFSLYGYICAGVWMAVLLFLTSYGMLAGATADNFQEASRIRLQALNENPLEANANAMAFVAAQGSVVALVFALKCKSSRSLILFSGVTLFCFTATFLPLSRSGVVTVFITSAIVMFACGNRAQTVLLAILIAVGTLIWVPTVVWQRMSFSTEVDSTGRMEGRAAVYTAAVEELSEHFVTGVGSGNFWGLWGRSSGFSSRRGQVYGAHNIFFQTAIYWGLPGVLALIAMIWQVYRCVPVPQQAGKDVLTLCLLAIASSLLFLSLVIHNLYAKEFSLGLGLLVGARRWIWPKIIVPKSSHQRRGLCITRRNCLAERSLD